MRNSITIFAISLSALMNTSISNDELCTGSTFLQCNQNPF